MKNFTKAVAVSLLMLMSREGFAQMGMMGPGMGPGMTGSVSMVRHRFAMMNGIGSYAYLRNPLPADAGNLTQGKALFDRNCATCHGAQGLGNGPAGANLSPPPANVAYASKLPIASDGYLFWTISEGGYPLGTAMPAFKNSLSEGDIWKIILYLRQL